MLLEGLALDSETDLCPFIAPMAAVRYFPEAVVLGFMASSPSSMPPAISCRARIDALAWPQSPDRPLETS